MITALTPGRRIRGAAVPPPDDACPPVHGGFSGPVPVASGPALAGRLEVRTGAASGSRAAADPSTKHDLTKHDLTKHDLTK